MNIDYTAIETEEPEHSTAIYYKNTLRNVRGALGYGSQFDAAWNAFASSNNFSTKFDELKKSWALPPSLAPLRQAKKIDKPRTALLLSVRPDLLFGAFRYGKLPGFSHNWKQVKSFHQVSIVQLRLAKNHYFLIDDELNHAARYVASSLLANKSSYKHRTLFGHSAGAAQAVADMLESLDFHVDVECDGTYLWLMKGGDSRTASALKPLLELGDRLQEILNTTDTTPSSPVNRAEYTKLPYGKVGLQFWLVDNDSRIAFFILIFGVALMVIIAIITNNL